MKIDCFIGIDPGANGGIAIKRKHQFTRVEKPPKKFNDINAILRPIFDATFHPVVVIENVHLRPPDLKNAGKALGMQKLFNHYTILKNVVESNRVPYVSVEPRVWQSYLNIRKIKDESDTDWKNRLKSQAQTFFPEVRATLWNADALLLVHFGMKKLTHEPEWISSNLQW